MTQNNLLIQKEIEKLLLQGKFLLVKQKLSKELAQKRKDTLDYWQLVFLKAKYLERTGEYEASLVLIEEALSSKLVQDESHLYIDFLLLKSRNYDDLGEISKEATIISKIDNLLNNLTPKQKSSAKYKEQLATFYQLQGWYYIIKTQFAEADEVLNLSLKLFEELKQEDQIASTFYNLGSLALRRGKYTEALTFLLKCLEIREQIGNKIDIGLSKRILGAYHRVLRDNDRALDYLFESKKLFEEMGHVHHLANSYNSLGVTFMHAGDLNKASIYFNNALKILDSVGNKRQIAYVHSNIGLVEKLRGNLDKALDAFLNGLEYFDQIGSIQNIGAQMLNIGDVYLRKGNYDKSLTFLKKGLEYRRRTGNKFMIARALYILVKIHTYINMPNEAKEYFIELKEIAANEDNKMLDYLAMIAEAFILKIHNRSRSRVKAEDLLQQIVNSKMVDFEIYLDAMLNLSELLIVELKVTSNHEVLSELQELIEKINTIARYQQSYWLLAEVYWIQSHLDLLNWQFDKAQESFTQAQIIAEEKGYDNLARRISQDYDKTFSQVEIWEQLRESNAPLVERIEATRLDDLIQKLKQQIIDVEELPAEQPVMLLILKKTGQPIYHKTFLSQAESANESLLSAFISSINIFFSEVFKTSGSIERIKHQDLTILFKSVNTLMFCYVFKGQSYTAIKKLDEFIFTLQTSYEDLWHIIVSHVKTTELLQETPSLGLDEIIDRIFLIKNNR